MCPSPFFCRTEYRDDLGAAGPDWEGENDLLANGENQTYSCVLGWVGNLNIRQMVFLPAPDSDGERWVGKATVEWGETWEVACNIKTFIFGDGRVRISKHDSR